MRQNSFRGKAEANANYDAAERKMKREHDLGTQREFAASQVKKKKIFYSSRRFWVSRFSQMQI